MKGNASVIRAYEKSVLATYRRAPVALVRGRGSWVWDADGKRYLDLFPGFGAGALGHCHPRVVAAVRTQVGRLIHVSNAYFNPLQAELAALLLRQAGFGGRAFFCNSGAEANEAAIKLARRWFQVIRKEPRSRIVSVTDSFHGRTLGALSATGQAVYRRGFAPLPGGFVRVRAGDRKAMARAVDRRTAAVIIEPILGEGGVKPHAPGYLKFVRALARKRGALLILDEVQTGCGRTGTFFAFRQLGVVPDLVTLSKPVAGGLPMGAMLVRDRYARGLEPGTHASTFGGSNLVCAAGLAAVRTATSPAVRANVRARAAQFRAGLEAIRKRHPKLVTDVRGMGLMLGVGLSRPAAGVVARCRELGVLLNAPKKKVLRMLPAMTIRPAEAKLGLSILEKALAEEDSRPKGAGPRLGKARRTRPGRSRR